MPRSSSHRGNLYPPITCLILLSKFMDNRLKAGTRELKEVSQEVRGILPKCKAANCLVNWGQGRELTECHPRQLGKGQGLQAPAPTKKIRGMDTGEHRSQAVRQKDIPWFGKWHFCIHHREVSGLCQMLGFLDLLKVRN